MKKNFAIILMLALSVSGLRAQGLLDFGIKATYSTIDAYELYSNVQQSVVSRNAELIKQSNIGLFLRVNLSDRFFLQPEIGFSPNTVWDSLDNSDNIFVQTVDAFNRAQSATVNIPILAGVRLFSIGKLLSMRLFVGPEFYTDLQGSKINWKTYSVIGGVGLDALGFLYADARVSYLPGADLSSTLSNIDKPSFYSFSVGIKF